jgi:hypothetical protein
MELPQEQFDQAIALLATKEDLQNVKDEILFRITDAMATIEEGLDPEQRLALIEQKLNRIEKILHVEL